MLNLIEMTHRFGSVVETNGEAEKKWNRKPGFILGKTGVQKRHRWAPEEDLCRIAAELGRVLIAKHGVLDKVQAVFGSANPYGTLIPSPTHRVASGLELDHDIFVGHINYGCGGWLGAVELMHCWLQQQPKGTAALFVLTDHPSVMVSDYTTGVLFSDALHVSLWANEEGVGGCIVEKPWMAVARGNISALSVKEDGYWNMDGGAIAKFVRSVPMWVAERMKIDLADFTIIPHQANVKLLETLEKDYGVSFYKEVVRRYGNPTCAGTMIALEKFLGENPKNEKDILVMGFGDSLSYGAFIVKHL